MKIKKDTTNNQWLFSDFDKDGIKNIDDGYPLNKEKGQIPKNNPTYFHKTRMVDTEIKLSNVLLRVRKHIKSFEPHFQKFLKENPQAKGRIKSVASVINKTVNKKMYNMGDIAGVKLLTKDRKEAYNLNKHIRKTQNVKRKYDDFYKNPKDKVYYALHNDLKLPNKQSMEIQIKSIEMDNFAKTTHTGYKKQKSQKKFIKEGRRLYRLGH